MTIIKFIIAIIIVGGLMFLSVSKLFKIGWKKMTGLERLMSIAGVLFSIIALLIVSIFIFNG